MEKKKTIVLTMIGLATLMLLVIGSAFAYFSITNNSDGETHTNFTGETDQLAKYRVPTITGESNLYLDLLVTDMAQGKIGTSYWATATKENRFEQNRTDHTVSTAGISGSTEEEAYLTCTSDLTITASIKESGQDEPIDYDIITAGDGTVYLGSKSETAGNKAKINPNKIDLATIISETRDNGGYKTIVNYSITGNSNVDMTAAIELKNTEDDQTALAGKDIDINITNENLVCSVGTKPTNKDIAEENDKANVLTDTSVGGMHRYQGTGEVNNYICLGDDCSENGNDLYRIIGITDDGEIKVIKKTALTNSMQWHTDMYSDIEWPDSDLFHQLNDYEGSDYGSDTYNSTSFYSTLSEQLKPYIVKKDWMYGDIDLANTSSDLYDGNKMYNVETGGGPTTHCEKNESNNNCTQQPYTWENTVNAYIGLQYIHDYLYAYPGGNPKNYEAAKRSWINIIHNDSSKSLEWLISRWGYNSSGIYTARIVDSNGYVSTNILASKSAVRPVFYLSNTVSLSGEGTLETPYTIFS